jgi:maltooligosyltrehalose trehalohydrolase
VAPRLRGSRALRAQALGPTAVRAEWRLGDGSCLTLYANLGPDTCPIPEPLLAAAPDRDALCFETDAEAFVRFLQGELGPDCALCFLEAPA